MKKILKRLFPWLRRPAFMRRGKYDAELNFWREEIVRYEEWFSGKLKELFGEPSPGDAEKVVASNIRDSAILTWAKVHQETKYKEDLRLPPDAFRGMKVLDIGSGPFASARVFEDCEVFCLDPLWGDYLKIGFPVHYYDRTRIIQGHSERIPVADGFFDAVISVNAIDHVDDFQKTAQEIKRVLRPGGRLRMHVHYHPRTEAEPLELNDEKMTETFRWCSGFRKIAESKTKRGFALNDEHAGETYAVWSN